MQPDLTGQTFSQLTVTKFNGYDSESRACWLCLCSCGNKTTVVGEFLIYRLIHDCGCHCNSKAYKHGLADTPEYKCWAAMLARCTNPNLPNYTNYGGRGIKVCKRWHNFEYFILDLGLKPSPDYSLERIDVNGDYEPKNCKWATVEEQANNRRNSIRLSWNNKTQTLKKWAEELNLELPALYQRYIRYKSGEWSLDKMMTKPPKNKNKNQN